jgi:hypothetical protein
VARTRVVLRRNGSKVGEVTYASESEAVAHAAKMQGAASGLEALLAPAPNRRKPRRNPSIGRGTKHRDRVEAAIERRLRAQGEPKASARSRAYAIATAAELRKNPTPIDIGSLDFGHFKKTVKIAGYYNVRTGRRFARVVSKDETFVTDVPVADGGKDGNRARGADAIKRRAYEQLRIHIQPTTWKPSVRVNPSKAGSVAYGGTSIRIHAGTYTVLPHGPSFSGPDGFVSAKKWIDTHGA